MYDECLEGSLILGIFSGGEFCGLAEFYGYRAPCLKRTAFVARCAACRDIGGAPPLPLRINISELR